MPDVAGFRLLAHPWWVNLLVFVPIAAYVWWRQIGLLLPARVLGGLTIWGIAFGTVEGAVVLYLRALAGIRLGYEASFDGMARFSSVLESQPLMVLPEDVLLVEIWREAATIVMLLGVAFLAVKGRSERAACFLWAFAVWDIWYYAVLWITTGWPSSLMTVDVLFLIPAPWVAPIWFPLLVSGAAMLAVILSRRAARSEGVWA